MSDTSNYYAILPAEVRYDNNISFFARILYSEITSLSNAYGFCFAQNETFANMFSVSVRQVQRALVILRENGYIKVCMNEKQRRIYPLTMTKMSRGDDKNVMSDHDKNVTHNNKNINNKFNNNSSEQNSEPPLITLTLNDKSEYPITAEYLREMEELYPNVDVMGELRKMRAWLLNNYQRRKTRQGITRFINSWLCREQDKAKVTQVDDTPPYYEEFVFDDDE